MRGDILTKIVGNFLLTASLLFGGHFAIVAAQEAATGSQTAEKDSIIQDIRAAKEVTDETRTIRRQEVQDRLERYARKVVDRYLRDLSTLKSRIQNSDLSGDLKKNILAQIDTRVSRLESLKTTIFSAATLEAIKNALKEAQGEAVAIKVVKNRYNALLLMHRFDTLFGKLDRAITEFEGRIATLKASGKDTTELEATLNQAKSKIAEAKVKLTLAKTKFDTLSPTSVASVNDASSAAHTGVVEAIQLTKDAHQLLQSLSSKIKVTQRGAP